MELFVCASEADYAAWRSVQMTVLPGERCATVEELRAAESPDRLLLLAKEQDLVLGSGLAHRAGSAGVGYVAPRVLPHHRRAGVGSALLRALAEHCSSWGFAAVRASVDDDEGSLVFAEHHGFAEVDRQIEQVCAVGEVSVPTGLPDGVEVVMLSERPGLWAECYETFGRKVLADFALYTPLEISAEQWSAEWAGDPMFLAVYDGEVVGCAGLDRDDDHPERGENALTAVGRGWRGTGLAAHLKRRTLHWAATHGISELYTWTQAGNTAMIRLNERLGYVPGQISVTVSRDLPM